MQKESACNLMSTAPNPPSVSIYVSLQTLSGVVVGGHGRVGPQGEVEHHGLGRGGRRRVLPEVPGEAETSKK